MKGRDFYRMMNSIDGLNQRYGNYFGYKLAIGLMVVSILFITIVTGIQHILKYKTSNEEFLLDSDSKYLISIEVPSTSSYYEIDFYKGTVIKRKDTNTFKREKLATIETDLNELQQFLMQIASDEKNLGLTEQERRNLFDQNCYWIYKITDYKHKDYYIKDVNQVKYLKELLKEPFV